MARVILGYYVPCFTPYLMLNLSQTDLPHDTDFPYVIRIIDDLRVIRPYHILIRICFKYTENPYTTHTNDNSQKQTI